ncbi:MAG: hypothetical protein ABIG89_03685 [Candidatus Woesearchaeota archaeon]
MVKKAQSAAGAAGLIALLAVFIVLYLLLIPPQERANLLGDSTYTNTNAAKAKLTGPFTINKTSLAVSPGRIDYLKFSSYDHPLPAINLYTTTGASVLTKENSLYIKNGIFDYLSKNITFKIKDIEFTDNVMISGSTKKAQGRLRLYLNGNLIYEGVAEPFPAISIEKEALMPENTVMLEVSPVGWQFWTTNEYTIENFQVTADITDISEQASKTTFIVADSEKFNIEKAELRFFPDCNPNAVGKLRVYFNNENVYSSIPDCSQLNSMDISPEIISAGTNSVTFKTDKGHYSIYQINVKTELKKQTYPTYYFEIDERLFVGEDEENDNLCGEVDGVCPANCDEDLDKDCCFEGRNKYWCDIVPEDEGDKCVSVVNTEICSRCASGYEDRNNKAADACKGKCGDDKDNHCPSGCSRYYDKDCCFDDSTDNYWCEDVPLYGVEQVCKHSLTQAQCDNCPSSYRTKTGSSYRCDEENLLDIKTLRDDFEVDIVLKFIDDSERKAANVYVNGHKFYIDTYKGEYSRKVTSFVEPGSNAVKIEPDVGSIDIRTLSIEVKPR